VKSWLRVFSAVLMAALCHGLFALAVGSMAFCLVGGMQEGLGNLPAGWRVFGNLLLVAQFPLLHSALLSRRGRPWLYRLSPVGNGRTLAPSTYVAVGSLQLILTFWAWTPSGHVWHTPSGFAGGLQYALFAAAWVFLIKALWDSGLGLQTGAIGWWALLRGKSVSYGDLPTRGLFQRCRQPIYLGFALVLWTAPSWSADWLLLTGLWSVYCVIGPLLKEQRWEAIYGARFRAYRASVPYFLPRLRR
jgi:methanethiol S-methyltransferase